MAAGPGVTPAMVAVRAAVRSTLLKMEVGEKVIVACSGGADSLALSHALAQEAPKFAISVIGITIDHQLQLNSGGQARRVLEQFADMAISPAEAIQVRVDLTDGLESSARRARYLALGLASEKYGARKIFLGHTRDDQAETVLLGLGRGSGVRSLSGMAADTGRYLRPLLGITRLQTEAACAEVGLMPWSDPHNDDLSLVRVRVRKQVIPVLESALGPGVRAALARSAALSRDDADALDGWATREFQTLEANSLDIRALAALPRAIRTRVIRLAIYRAGTPAGTLSADHVAAVEALVSNWHGQGEVSLPGGVKAGRLSGRLSFLPHPH
ncbi:MAG: tRNA lysidine(34) synthetase TilS [Actinobacteria bacterium]|nr:tRNA lysidine(34) synthetase TilS [Actinomycetota bacterium]